MDPQREDSKLSVLAVMHGLFGIAVLLIAGVLGVRALTSSKPYSATALGAMILGISYLVAARGLWTCRTWGRALAILVATFWLVASLIALFSVRGWDVITAGFQILWTFAQAALLTFLLTKPVRRE